MKIKAVAINNFRSLKDVQLLECGNANIFIGKNNSGKSNLLSAVAVAMSHLRSGRFSSTWPRNPRSGDEFFDRNVEQPIEIGLQFEMANEDRNFVLEAIGKYSQGVDVAIENAKKETSLVIIVRGIIVQGLLSCCVCEVGFGGLKHSKGAELQCLGHKIFSVSDDVAHILVLDDRQRMRLIRNLQDLDRVEPELLSRPLFTERPREQTRYYVRQALNEVSLDLQRRVEGIVEAAKDQDSFLASMKSLRNETQIELEEIENEQLEDFILSFSGKVHKVPTYLSFISDYAGSVVLLHFLETREAIGPEEASQLLRLKTKRGGTKQLAALQDSVKSLLDVSVDAFEIDIANSRSRTTSVGPRAAEMDIDDFLVELNGSGIREALRIIIDIELKLPGLVLIEEPEVHLHPGLEKVVHSYLLEKSLETQVFIATHSTNFIDVSASQNVYIVTQNKEKGSLIEKVLSKDDLLKIPEEIGLKPSTLFMFDCLVFVEGRSDEEIIVELSQKLKLEISSRKVGFVRMGGGSNARNFASEATIDLLSRRQIPMLFIIDSDERTKEEIQKLTHRLGAKAQFHALKKREMENYLLEPQAILSLITEKNKSRGSDQELPTLAEIMEKLNECACALQDRVISLRTSSELLLPIYPGRLDGNTPKEKLEKAIMQIEEINSSFDAKFAKIREDVDSGWKDKSRDRAPGSEILETLMSAYGLTYHKTRDAARLASFVEADSIPQELKTLLRLIEDL